MKALFEFLLVTLLPCAAFSGGYVLTDRVFCTKLIPYPFEGYGIAVGAGCFFWTLALLTGLVGKKRKK